MACQSATGGATSSRRKCAMTSRIRASFKDSWRRNLLRVKGGITGYCMSDEIDVQVLRAFQSSHRSPAKSFKPVPDGFEIDFGRKVLPAGEKE